MAMYLVGYKNKQKFHISYFLLQRKNSKLKLKLIGAKILEGPKSSEIWLVGTHDLVWNHSNADSSGFPGEGQIPIIAAEVQD